MSSATSIERLPPERSDRLTPADGRPPSDPSTPSGSSRAASRDQRERFNPWHFFVLISLLAATVAVVLSRRPTPEHLVFLSLTIAAAGLCAGALYSTLAPLVRKDSREERVPLSDRARAALEREKMLALRSIKELEFDRAMGKLSAADFDEMAGRLRARAITLMKQLDAGGPLYRAAIEQELSARLAQASVPLPACACGTSNDADAVFCKRCGTRLQPERHANGSQR